MTWVDICQPTTWKRSSSVLWRVRGVLSGAFGTVDDVQFVSGWTSAVIRRAWKETCNLLLPDSWKKVVRDGVLLLVLLGLVLLAKPYLQAAGIWKPAGTPLLDRALPWLFGLAALVAVFGAYFMLEAAFIAPYRLLKDERASGPRAQAERLAAERLEEIERLKLKISPETVKSSPTYVRLSFMLDPERGSHSPIDKLATGIAEFGELSARALRGDREAFFIATHVALWLREVARSHYASGKEYVDLMDTVDRRLRSMEEAFRSPA